MIKKICILYLILFSLPLSVFAKPIFIGQPEQKPLEVALAFLHDVLSSGDTEGKEEVTIQQSRIFCKAGQTCPLKAQIIYTIDGLNDDSIVKKRYNLILQQNISQSWEIVEQHITQACRKGRGHSNFSEALCR